VLLYLEDYIRGKLTREEIRKKLYRLRFLPFAGREAKKTIREWALDICPRKFEYIS